MAGELHDRITAALQGNSMQSIFYAWGWPDMQPNIKANEQIS
jgi:hypothetical protein